MQILNLLNFINQKSTLESAFTAGDGRGLYPDELYPSFECRGGATHHNSLPQHTCMGSGTLPATFIQSCELQGLDRGEDSSRWSPGATHNQGWLLGMHRYFSSMDLQRFPSSLWLQIIWHNFKLSLSDQRWPLASDPLHLSDPGPELTAYSWCDEPTNERTWRKLPPWGWTRVLLIGPCGGAFKEQQHGG